VLVLFFGVVGVAVRAGAHPQPKVSSRRPRT
jgi:hypothetical protein